MQSDKVFQLLAKFKDDIPSEKYLLLQNALSYAGDEYYERLLAIDVKSSTTVLILSIFLGGYGIDRFIIGDVTLGILKLLFGWATLGIWPLVDIFFSYKKAKEINFDNIMKALM